MNTKSLLLVFALLWVSSLSLSAQTLVSANKAITQDTLLTTIQRNSVSSKNVIASGQAVFASKSGYVRILLSDDYDYDLLVYESSPLVAVNGIDDFSGVSMETVDIPSRHTLTKVRVEIKNAELRNLSVDVSAISPSRTQQQVKADRIALINSNLRNQNALWVAGETEVSQMSYQEKKGLFGGNIPDLQGFEYYVGGIFELFSDSVISNQNTTRASSYISSFDWRNRHGANNPSSPYYNSGGHGWITTAKNQNPCGSCAIFSVIGTIESLTNLYYNRFLNKDLSEQEMVSCIPNGGSCATNTGWFPSAVIDYIVTNGVSEDPCFLYTATDLPCSNKCSNPTENLKVSGRINCGTSAFPKTVDAIKHNIIKYGPISGGVYSLSHAMSIVGYKDIVAGDEVYTSMYNKITIPPNDSRSRSNSMVI